SVTTSTTSCPGCGRRRPTSATRSRAGAAKDTSSRAHAGSASESSPSGSACAGSCCRTRCTGPGSTPWRPRRCPTTARTRCSICSCARGGSRSCPRQGDAVDVEIADSPRVRVRPAPSRRARRTFLSSPGRAALRRRRAPFPRRHAMTELLAARGVTKSYWLGKREIPVLRGVDFAVEAGEMVALLGASGAGKSTLLHVLGQVEAQTGGEVRGHGEPVTALPVRRKAKLRHQSIGFVFQFYHLIPELTALQNVLLGQMMFHTPLAYLQRRQAIRARALALLEE